MVKSHFKDLTPDTTLAIFFQSYKHFLKSLPFKFFLISIILHYTILNILFYILFMLVK